MNAGDTPPLPFSLTIAQAFPDTIGRQANPIGRSDRVSGCQDVIQHARQRHLPSQNAVEVFDGQWRCRSGYRRTNGICTIPTAPEHATLIGEGDRWECDWGFRKVASRCEEINPPSHAYLDAAGRDWVCFPGFERVSDHCVRMPGTETDPL